MIYFLSQSIQWKSAKCCPFSSGIHVLIAVTKYIVGFANFLSRILMMTSSNGSIFRVTGPLCGEFTGEFHSQRPVTRSFDVFFDLRLNILLSKQAWGWWFETPLRPLWRYCNVRINSRNLVWCWCHLWRHRSLSTFVQEWHVACRHRAIPRITIECIGNSPQYNCGLTD